MVRKIVISYAISFILVFGAWAYNDVVIEASLSLYDLLDGTYLLSKASQALLVFVPIFVFYYLISSSREHARENSHTTARTVAILAGKILTVLAATTLGAIAGAVVGESKPNNDGLEGIADVLTGGLVGGLIMMAISSFLIVHLYKRKI